MFGVAPPCVGDRRNQDFEDLRIGRIEAVRLRKGSILKSHNPENPDSDDTSCSYGLTGYMVAEGVLREYYAVGRIFGEFSFFTSMDRMDRMFLVWGDGMEWAGIMGT